MPVVTRSRAVWALRAVGAALLLAVAGVHGYLWQQGYRDIDVIGPAFLLQTVLAVGGALLVLAAPRRLLPWAAAAGAAFAAGSLGALVLSTTVGLFGFVETTQAQLWWESFWVELAAVVVLTLLAVRTAGRTAG
ncbi:hypothetical protein [Modestobacter sp. URMC 112]